MAYNGVEVRQAWLSDLERRYGRRPSVVRVMWALAVEPGVRAVALYRAQQWAQRRNLYPLAKVVSSLNHALCGADFQPGCEIAGGLSINHPTGIVVGKGVVVGRGATVCQSVTLGERHADGQGDHTYPRVGNNVTLSVGCCILGNISLGSNSVVGANSVLFADLPPFSLAVGVPARTIALKPTSERGRR